MPILATNKCNLPVKENFNLQLRIIRRILEQKRDEFDKIVVHVEKATREFLKPFYCYFPRTNLDEEIACHYLESSIGGPNGEPVIPERVIRIKSKPAILDPMNQSIDLRSGLDLSTVVGRTPFSKMHDDLDKERSRLNSNNANTNSKQMMVSRPLHKSVLRGCILL